MRRDPLTWWAYGVVASFAFVLNGFGPLLDDLRDELDVSRTVIGLHSTGIAAGTLVVGAGGEWLRRRLGWTRMYWLACAALVGGVVGLAAADAPGLTLPATVVLGAVGAILLVMIPGVLNVRHGAAAGAAVAEAHASASLLGVVAPLAVGFSLAAFDTWLPAFLAITAVALPLLGVAGPRLPSVATTVAGDGSPVRLPRAYWPWWTALLFGVATEFAILLWAVDDADERLGLGVGAAALAPSAFLLGMASIRGAGARLVIGRDPSRLYRAAALVAMAGFVLYRATDLVSVALIGLVIVGLGVGLLYPTSLSAAMAAAPGAEAQASTRSALASGVAIGSGPLALGALADAAGLDTASWIVLALLAAGMARAR